MAEDRFANVFTAELTMSAANTGSYAELQFGITLRDMLAIAIDEIYFYPSSGSLAEMTAAGDEVAFAITVSDQVGNLFNLADRRILFLKRLKRLDAGTAATGNLIELPLKESFFPPLIVIPNRIYFAMISIGLASAADGQIRMHYRTVSITKDQQLIEVLEAFQLST